MRTEPLPATLQPALTPAQAAGRLRVSVKALAALRRAGTGPDYLAISRRTIRYLTDDLMAWKNRELAAPERR
jgi:hypothetical protein